MFRHHGVASHIISEAFALVDMEVEYGFFPWKRAFMLAENAETWHGSAVWFYNEERAQSFLYSNPVIAVNMAFFHLREVAFDWETMGELHDTRIGATLEYFYGAEFHDAVDSQTIGPEWAATDELNLKKLLRGRIDVFPGAVLVTYTQIQDTFGAETAERFTHHPRIMKSDPLHLVFGKANPESEQLVAEFDRGLQLLKESGRYDEIIADGIAGKYARSQ